MARLLLIFALAMALPVALLALARGVAAQGVAAPTVTAQTGGLRPPCGNPTEPPYAAPGAEPNVGIWHESDLQSAHWNPAACLGWSGRSRLAVSVAGEFTAAGGLDELLRKIGGFSRYSSIRFWSPTRRDWRPLVEDAGLLPAAGSGADAVPSQFVAGRSFDYFEVDPAGRSTYRMTVRERSPERVVLAIENTSAIRLALLPLFDPGALQSVVFLEHQGGNLWHYYQALRANDGASTLALGSTASYVNRATAFYRYLAWQQSAAPSGASARSVR
jgi:hypothetical protein